jgi:hypothetical protein
MTPAARTFTRCLLSVRLHSQEGSSAGDGIEHTEGESSRVLCDESPGLDPRSQSEAALDGSRLCGSDPADIRLINRRNCLICHLLRFSIIQPNRPRMQKQPGGT